MISFILLLMCLIIVTFSETAPVAPDSNPFTKTMNSMSSNPFTKTLTISADISDIQRKLILDIMQKLQHDEENKR